MPDAAPEEQLVPHDPGSGSEEDLEGEEKKKGGGLSKRTRVPIYKKLLAIREVDRLIEDGVKRGIEKKVMAMFPDVFMGTKGKMKSGMIGRWMLQCDEQDWRKIPFERMSAQDQELKDLPDWIRLPMGLEPRSIDKFKSGTHVPGPVTKKIIELIERITCGQGGRLTSGTLHTDSVKKEAEELLTTYNDAQRKAAEEHGIKLPATKNEVSTRWVNRLLAHYGWKRNAPNTYGAYLEYDDERMVKSRKAWRFLRPGWDVGRMDFQHTGFGKVF